MRNHFERDVIASRQLPEPELGERFGRAMNLAIALHRKQSRKGTAIPYASHLLGVASLVLEHGGSEDEAIGALLHDALEDQAGEDPEPLKREIRDEFGDAVLAIVLACSDSASSVDKPDWRMRKEAYLHHLADAPAPVLLVSLADKLHNARAILKDYREQGEALWQRFNGGREGTLWYYRALAEAFRSGGQPGLLAELERVVAELEGLARNKAG